MPYGAAVDRIFPGLDAYGYSYSVGVLKPHPSIYCSVLDQLAIEPSKVWMIGDSPRCDRDGPTAQGI
ncbi:HAD family hydrolase [Pseudomonas fragi]|uniref:HAD family hydrolase n=1 Tax=Pseudomonas fragi TaxID=296 RepID=UPI0021CCAFFE|nr:HAD family hydrolase [Pseudomonas fragi]